MIMPISSPHLYKDGWLLRLGIAHSTFNYLSLAGQDIHGTSRELEASVGYLAYLGDRNNRLSVYLGGVYRDARLSPDDPFSQIEEKHKGIRVQGDLFLRPVTEIDFSIMGSRTANLGDKWLRLRAGYVFAERIVLGPELQYIRGTDYERRRVGLALENISLGRHAQLTISAGRERDRVSGTSGYAGASLVGWF